MRTLLEYLMLEAKKPDLPSGFELISLSGGLSNEAKQILQASSYKKAKIGALSPGGRTAIKNGLKTKPVPSATDPIEFVKEFFKADSILNQYVDEASEKEIKRFGGNTDDAVFLELKNANDGSWKDVGGKGKVSSSIRVIRFWVESTMMTYLEKPDVGVGFAFNKAYNLFYVYRK